MQDASDKSTVMRFFRSDTAICLAQADRQSLEVEVEMSTNPFLNV